MRKLKMYLQKISLDKQNLCACFIDWQKLSDHINWKKLMQILKEMDIDSRERRLISKLYLDQRVKIQLDSAETWKCEEWKRTLHVPYLCITEYYYTYVTDQQMNTNKIYLSYTIIYQQLSVAAAAIYRVSHNNTDSCTEYRTKMTQCYSQYSKHSLWS